jgi:ATP-dependent Clp protease ATP-binding subunit ClpA
MCGNAFVRLKEQKHDIQGRDKESAMLVRIMERPLTPIASLIGPAGVGKSALVEDFVKRVGRGEIQSLPGREYFVVSLRIGNLKTLGNDKLQAVMSNMLDEMAKLEKIAQEVLQNKKIRLILFIDEFHMLVTIFGPGTKIGGDLMKDVLARASVKVITATTRKEFDSTIAVDEPFKERFKEIELNELPTHVVLDICKNWWQSNVPKLPMPNDQLIMKVLNANKAFRAQQAEPRKSLDIMEDLVASMLVTQRPVTEDVIDEIFKDRFHINLNLDFDADGIFANVKKRVKGQALALYELQRALRAVAFQLDKNPNKPIMTLLLTGSTGTGKSLLNSILIPSPYSETGYIRMGDIKVGDYVYDRKGRPTKVLGVFPQGPREVFEIKFTDGRTILADGEHLFSYYTAKQKLKYDNNQYKNGAPKFKTNSVNELLKLGVKTQEANGRSKVKFYLPVNEAVERTPKEFKLHPYELGTLLSDSYFDNDKLSEIPELINCDLHDKFIPNDYKLGSIEQRWHLIKGLFDADGSIANDKSFDVTYTSISEKLISDIQEVLWSLGVMSTIVDDNEQSGYTLQIKSQNNEKNRFFSLPRKLEICDLAEKQDAHKKRIKKFNFVGIESITKLSTKEDMTCILVDNDEHLFLAGREHIVTHNTETTKAICETLYPGENVLQNFNMPDYKLESAEPAFRKKLGETVRHQPNSVILLDEFEKGSDAIKDSMLAILDEGIVNFEVENREGQVEIHKVSLRNTIVIATTNAGHEVFQNMAEFAQDNDGFSLSNTAKSQYEQLRNSLNNHLKMVGFKPEMLGRFDRIIPYRNLTENVMIEICDAIIDNYFDKLLKLKGIKIERAPKVEAVINNKRELVNDLSAFITKIRARSEDSTAGGARQLKRAIKTDIEDPIIDTVLDNPGKKHFRVYVSKQSRLFDPGASDTKGGIVIDVLD